MYHLESLARTHPLTTIDWERANKNSFDKLDQTEALERNVYKVFMVIDCSSTFLTGNYQQFNLNQFAGSFMESNCIIGPVTPR